MDEASTAWLTRCLQGEEDLHMVYTQHHHKQHAKRFWQARHPTPLGPSTTPRASPPANAAGHRHHWYACGGMLVMGAHQCYTSWWYTAATHTSTPPKTHHAKPHRAKDAVTHHPPTHTWSSDNTYFNGTLPELALRQHLMDDYDKSVWPWVDWGGPVNVTMSLAVQKIINVDLVQAQITINVWWRLRWHDPRLRWDPADYNNITKMFFSSSHQEYVVVVHHHCHCRCAFSCTLPCSFLL